MPKTSFLRAISPIDGRYALKTAALSDCFSEYALFYFRLMVEIRWFEHLSHIPLIKEFPPLNGRQHQFLQNILNNFDSEAAQEIKEIERTTNHDVKAVEYYLKNRMIAEPGLSKQAEFVHFGCTSEDINNLAYALMVKQAHESVVYPMLQDLNEAIRYIGKSNSHVAMMAHTHGQPASPTTLGKEFINFVARLDRQLERLKSTPILGKMNGAVGNFNAHFVAYPDVNWPQVSRDFIKSIGLTANLYTTQIEPHDFIADIGYSFCQINNILSDLSRDCWTYISMDYFKQRSVKGEIGSSTMPHKINPIDFENAEGNLGIANALFIHFSTKLPISRLQRDLTDSTVLRNLGVAYSHSVIAYKSLHKGLSKLVVNEPKMSEDLDAQWLLLGEAIQTVMRKYALPNPYEQLKTLTRGKRVNRAAIHTFINGLDLPRDEKDKLIQLTPTLYTGLAAKLTEKYPF